MWDIDTDRGQGESLVPLYTRESVSLSLSIQYAKYDINEISIGISIRDMSH
jgi:hypothetical protein